MFHIHPVPDKVMTLVIQHMYGALSSSAIAAPSLTGRTDYDETKQCSNVCSIARLLFVLGQTCLSSLVYTEAIAATAKKYPSSTSCSSSKENPTGGGRESKNRGAAKASSSSSSSSSSPSSSGKGTTGFTENVEAVDAMEEEMGAAAADDADREKVLPRATYMPYLILIYRTDSHLMMSICLSLHAL